MNEVQNIVKRIRAEFLEMPGLTLTAEQMQRLCGIDAHTCEIVLSELLRARFLRTGHGGAYFRATEGSDARRHAAKANLAATRSRSRHAS